MALSLNDVLAQPTDGLTLNPLTPKKNAAVVGNSPAIPTPLPTEPSSLARRVVGDPLVSLGKGIVSVPEAAVGLADLVSGGQAGKAVQNAGIDFQKSQLALNDLYSPEQQQANQNVQNAQGFVPTLKAMGENPSVIPNTIAQSVPLMLGGQGIARGAMTLAPKLAPVIAGAIGEGAVTAGSNAESVRRQTPDGLLTPAQAALTAGSGLLTGAITHGSGKLADSLGVGDVNQMLLNRGVNNAIAHPEKSMLRRGIEGGLVEGAQETTQSAQEQAVTNLALEKPIDEGVGNAAALGLATGIGMGAPTGAMQRRDYFNPALNRQFDPANNPTHADLQNRARRETLALNGLGTPTWQEPNAQIKPDAQKVVDNRTVPAQSIQDVINSQVKNQSSYNPLAGTWEQPTAVMPNKLNEVANESDNPVVQNGNNGIATESVESTTNEAGQVPLESSNETSPLELSNEQANDTSSNVENGSNGVLSSDNQTPQTPVEPLDSKTGINNQANTSMENAPKSQTPESNAAQQSNNDREQVSPEVPAPVSVRQDANQLEVSPESDLVTKKDGKPFATESIAKSQLAVKGLSKTHEITPVDGGFALKPIQKQKSYDDIQSEVLKERGISDDKFENELSDDEVESVFNEVAKRQGRDFTEQQGNVIPNETNNQVTEEQQKPVETTGFAPTHELSTGEQVKEVIDEDNGNYFVDKHGNEYGDDYATPLNTQPAIQANANQNSPQATNAVPVPETQTQSNANQTVSYDNTEGLLKRPSDGQPFVDATKAKQALKNNPRLDNEEHAVVPVNGGFAIAPIASMDYQQFKSLPENAPHPDSVLTQTYEALTGKKADFSQSQNVTNSEQSAKNAQSNNSEIPNGSTPESGKVAPIENVQPVEKSPENKQVTSDVSKKGENLNTLAGKITKIVTPKNDLSFDAQYEILPTNNVITSHDGNLHINPNFPQELQPRNRTAKSYETDLQHKVANFNPELVGESADSSTGAPIVDNRGVVISGNGRTIALNKIHNQGGAKSEQYKQWLLDNAEKFGLDKNTIANTDKPVLVRRIKGDVNLGELARKSNDSSIKEMSVVEQAFSDADSLSEEIFTLYDGGKLTSNRDFVNAFTRGTNADNIYDDSGMLSQKGITRIESAIMAKSYGNEKIVADLYENADTEVKSLLSALLKSSSSWLKLRAAFEQTGTKDLTPHLVDAVMLVKKARMSDGQSVKSLVMQRDLMSIDSVHPLTEQFVNLFFYDANLSKYIAADKVADILNETANNIAKNIVNKDMFGENLTPAQILDKVYEQRIKAKQEQPKSTPSGYAGNLFNPVVTRGDKRRESERREKAQGQRADSVGSKGENEEVTLTTDTTPNSVVSVKGDGVETLNQPKLSSDELAKGLANAVRGNGIGYKKNKDGTFNLTADGNHVATVDYAPSSAEQVTEQILKNYKAALDSEGKTLPSNPEDMTRDQFLIANKFGNLIEDFEISGADIQNSTGGLKVNADGTFGIDHDALYDRIQSQKKENVKKIDAPVVINTIDAHNKIYERIDNGEITADEFKAAFNSLLENKDAILKELDGMTKDKLMSEFRLPAYSYRSEKKDRVVSAAFDSLLDDFKIGKGVSYTIGGDMKNAYTNAIKRMVEATTDEQIKSYAKAIVDSKAERAKANEAKKEGIENPQTLEDFQNAHRAFMAKGDYKTAKEARVNFTPEQLERYDALMAEETRGKRKSTEERVKSAVRTTATTTEGKVIEGTHTKTGEPIFTVKAADRVDKDTYQQWNSTAKRLGGYYSRFGGGFIFKTNDNATAFLSYLGGDAESAKEAIATRRNAFEDDSTQSAVERLREMSDRMESDANDSLNQDRKANTHRRARQAASAESAANAWKATAQTMRKIAGAIESGKAKMLDGVRARTHIDLLKSLTDSAKWQSIQAMEKGKSWTEIEQLRAKPATKDVAEFVKYPAYSAYRSDLATLARKLLDNEGTKKLGKQLFDLADDVSKEYEKFAKENLPKVTAFSKQHSNGLAETARFESKAVAESAIKKFGFKGQAIVLSVKPRDNIIILSPSEAIKRGIWKGDDKQITLPDSLGKELVEKIGRNKKFDIPWYFENVHTEQKRLSAMNIETPQELRAAIREFVDLREVPKAPDRVKELERAMVGRQNDGLDFFPTPAPVVQSMLDAADIQNGMSVLEPSAGMGHIADLIREQTGVEPDVIELSNKRRELLEAKGYRVIGDDFLEIKPREILTYGDLFEEKDGTRGILAGVGGLGSNSVKLLDEKTGESLGFFDRDNIKGIEKRGAASGYDRIIMNPPFGDRRDAEHIKHAYKMLNSKGRLVAIVGEGVFFGQDAKAKAFREWLENVGGTDEKLENGSFNDPTLPVTTNANARMVVIDKGARFEKADDVVADDNEIKFSKTYSPNDFVTAPDGSLDFGEITPEIAKAIGRQSAKIKLRYGDEKAGLIHIKNRHNIDLNALGFESIEDFISEITKNFTEIYKSEKPNSRGLILVEKTGRVKFANIQLEMSDSGDFYEVKNATPARSDQFKNKNPIWERNGTIAPNENQTILIPDAKSVDESINRFKTQSTLQPNAKPRGITENQANAVIARFKNEFNGLNGVTVESYATLADAIGEEQAAKLGRVKGFFNPATNTVVIIRNNVDSINDTFKTLRHEILGHYGLDVLGKKEKAAFLADVIKAKANPFVGQVFEKVKADYPELSKKPFRQAEEVFARIVEQTPSNLQDFTDRLIAKLAGFLRKIGLLKGVFTKAEMREFAKTIAANIRDGKTNPDNDPDGWIRFSKKDKPLLAPNGKPSNLNAMQHAQVRTPQFKAWFGDFEQANQKPLKIIELTGNEIQGLSPKEARENAKQFIDDLIANLIAETGTDVLHNVRTGFDIRLTKKGVVHGFQHQGAPTIKAIAGIKELVENAAKIATMPHEPANENFASVHTFVAPLRIGSNLFAVKLTAKEEWNGKIKLYDHQALEMPDGIYESISDKSDSIHRPASGEVSVEQTLTAFKGENLKYVASKVVDENGEPLVVFHTGKWNEGDAKFDGFHFGIHFGTKDAANEFSRSNTSTTAAFLNIKNPSELPDISFGTTDQTAYKLQQFGILSDQDLQLVDDYFMLQFGENGTETESNSKIGKLFMARFNENGFDGIRYENAHEAIGSTSYIAFNPNQIKSATGNNGNFDANNNDIRFSKELTTESEIGNEKPKSENNTTQSNHDSLLKRAQNVIHEKLDAMSPLGKLPELKNYLAGRYKTLGNLAKVEEIAKSVYDTFRKASKADAEAVYRYLTTKDATVNEIHNVMLRKAAKDVKNSISEVGKQLVARGFLDQETHDKYDGMYLPRVYLKHILGDDLFTALGSGKTPSDLGYLKQRKDIPEEVRRLILMEIKDPAYLAGRALSIPMRDIAIFNWFDEIANNKSWVWEQSYVTMPLTPEGQPEHLILAGGDGVSLSDPNNPVYGDFIPTKKGKDGVFKPIDLKPQAITRKVTPFFLSQEAERMRKQAHAAPEQDRADIMALADLYEQVADKAIEGMAGNGTPKDFVQMPKSKRYGALAGLIVRKEIHSDIVGTMQIYQGDPSTAQKILGDGGALAQYTSFWKFMKVAANPPSHVRNIVSNLVMLHLSGVSFAKVPQRVFQAIHEIRNGGKHWDVAKRGGVTQSTYANTELFRMNKELNELIASNQESAGWDKLKAMMKLTASHIENNLSDWYQFMESVGKVAKIIDVMEKGGTEEDAILQAHEALFDYSLVSENVRYLRNAPLGTPFATFYSKALPMLIKTAVTHPERFLPYILMFQSLGMLVAAQNDVDDDDLDKLKMSLQEFLREKGHAYFLPFKDDLGRWQAMDFGYFVPWTMFLELGKEAARGDVMGAMRSIGVLGSPVADLITALKTGNDSFTRKPIVNEFDTPAQQLGGILNYLWRMNMPTFLTDIGASGKLIEALISDVDKYGEPKSTVGQALARFAGVNIYGIDPENERAKNIHRKRFEMMEAKQEWRKHMKDLNSSDSDKQKASEHYREVIGEMEDDLVQYARDSEIHPNLRVKFDG